MKKKNSYKDPWTQTFPQDLADDWRQFASPRATGSSLTLKDLEAAYSKVSDGEGGWTIIDEDDPGTQLWDKLQELLPGKKTECPIRKKITTQVMDPYDLYLDPRDKFKQEYGF